MRDVFRVDTGNGDTLALLTEEAAATQLAQWAGGSVARLVLFDDLEEFVLGVTRQTTIAEEINFRRGLGLPCDTDQIVARRTQEGVLAVAIPRLEPPTKAEETVEFEDPTDDGLVHPTVEVTRVTENLSVLNLSESMQRKLVEDDDG